MKQRVLTGLAIFLVVAVIFLTKIIIGTPIIFDIFVGLIAIIAGFEIAKILDKSKHINHFYLIVAFPILAYVLMLICIMSQFSAVLTAILFLSLFILIGLVSFFITLFSFARTENEMRVNKIRTSKSAYALKKALNSTLGMIYPTLPIMLLIPLNHLSEINYIFGSTIAFPTITSIILCAICFIIPCLCDTFAYIMGLAIGGPKLAPKISPKKTISGAIGGVLWTVILLVVLFLIFNSIPTITQVFTSLGIDWWQIAILGFVGAVACVFGDLFESYLKRKADVKDSGDILPGHGGVLDRIDGLIFVVIVVFITLLIIA